MFLAQQCLILGFINLINFIYLFIYSSVSVTFLIVYVLQRMLAAPQLWAWPGWGQSFTHVPWSLIQDWASDPICLSWDWLGALGRGAASLSSGRWWYLRSRGCPATYRFGLERQEGGAVVAGSTLSSGHCLWMWVQILLLRCLLKRSESWGWLASRGNTPGFCFTQFSEHVIDQRDHIVKLLDPSSGSSWSKAD